MTCPGVVDAVADVNLDDTSNCPQADRCAGCGSTTELAVVVVNNPLGMACSTVCPMCRKEGRFGISGWSSAALAVGAHAVHLGITVDTMAEILAAEADQP